MKNALLEQVVEGREVVEAAGRPVPAFKVVSHFAGINYLAVLVARLVLISEDVVAGPGLQLGLAVSVGRLKTEEARPGVPGLALGCRRYLRRRVQTVVDVE